MRFAKTSEEIHSKFLKNYLLPFSLFMGGVVIGGSLAPHIYWLAFGICVISMFVTCVYFMTVETKLRLGALRQERSKNLKALTGAAEKGQK